MSESAYSGTNLNKAVSAAIQPALREPAEQLHGKVKAGLRQVMFGMRRGEYGEAHMNHTLKVEQSEWGCVVVSLVDKP